VTTIDAERLREDFLTLAEIGRRPEGGVSRTSFSDAHLEARAWFHRRAAEAGLETRLDAAGNHSAVLPGPSEQSATLLLGSHLDTVPVAGCYDGALGVLAALEVLRCVKDARLTLPVALEAIDFSDEEGALVGLLGSLAIAGALTEETLAAPRGGPGMLATAITRAGLRLDRLTDARRDPASLSGYLELHIEQGPTLERQGVAIGVVTAIAGSRSYRLTFEGARRHAGTTPMDARRDALLGAARFALAVPEVVGRAAGCVGTVGGVEIERAAFNVVPGCARLLLELRAPTTEQLDALEAEVLGAAARDAAAAQLGLTIERVGRWEPVALDASIQDEIADAASELGLSAMRLPSGAGHDAQALAPITPTGMIFVPSVGGISHDPDEHTRWDDCVDGANVLLAVALRLAHRGDGLAHGG
jgi:hydantoinase/carbamoylase family amidase